jgi:hypothetical protein
VRPIPAAARAVLVTIGVLFGCSPSDGSASIGPPPGVDSGTPDAGAAPDAGAPDAGTPDSGSPGETPDAGTPDAGGGGGGPIASDCDGVMPGSLGPSFTATDHPGVSTICTFATSDFAGNVALEIHQTTLPDHLIWGTYTSTGSPLGGIVSSRNLIPRDVGFEGVNFWDGAGAPMDMFHFYAWTPIGFTTSSESVGSDACQIPTAWYASTGGAVVLSSCGPLNGVTHVDRFDGAGARLFNRTAALATYRATQAAASDSNGNTLVVAYPGNEVGLGSTDLVGRWLDGSGAFLTDWFVIATGGTSNFAVHSLIGGGAAVMQDEGWRAVLPSGGPPQAPPDWLASRSGKDMYIVRGRGAYAFTSRAGASEVELVSPAGNRCGAIDVGGAHVTVGGDGTVFTQTGDGGCRRTWYPALLR